MKGERGMRLVGKLRGSKTSASKKSTLGGNFSGQILIAECKHVYAWPEQVGSRKRNRSREDSKRGKHVQGRRWKRRNQSEGKNKFVTQSNEGL